MKVIDAIGAVQSMNDNVSSVYVDKYRWRGGVVKNFNILGIFSISMIVKTLNARATVSPLKKEEKFRKISQFLSINFKSIIFEPRTIKISSKESNEVFPSPYCRNIINFEN